MVLGKKLHLMKEKMRNEKEGNERMVLEGSFNDEGKIRIEKQGNEVHERMVLERSFI